MRLPMMMLVITISAFAQSGGTYDIEKSVVSSGGGSAAGGSYIGTFTTGQPAAGGFLAGAPNRAYTGFWTPAAAPTAANVSLSGQIFTNEGSRLVRAHVVLTDRLGITRTSSTGTFGIYRFDELLAGETYLITVVSRRYTFNPRVITLNDNIFDFDFTAEPK